MHEHLEDDEYSLMTMDCRGKRPTEEIRQQGVIKLKTEYAKICKNFALEEFDFISKGIGPLANGMTIKVEDYQKAAEGKYLPITVKLKGLPPLKGNHRGSCLVKDKLVVLSNKGNERFFTIVNLKPLIEQGAPPISDKFPVNDDGYPDFYFEKKTGDLWWKTYHEIVHEGKTLITVPVQIYSLELIGDFIVIKMWDDGEPFDAENGEQCTHVLANYLTIGIYPWPH